MIALSQDTKAFIDMCAGEVQPVIQQDQNTGEQVIVGYHIVLFSFNVSFPVAFYQREEEAQAMFVDLLACLKKGEEFYDFRAREQAVFSKKR